MSNLKYTVPENRKVRYIIHTDCKNEADDQYTLVHAILLDKLYVKGIIGGHFCQGNKGRYPENTTATESRKEIEKVLELMGLKDKYPVFTGAQTGLLDEKTPIDNEAVQFIIEEAMKDDDRPLFIGMQGAITDLASAILIEPKICERMTCIWIGGAAYPDGGNEFNLAGDVNGANVVFSSKMPLWQVPESVFRNFTASLAELQLKVSNCGELGEYLFEQLVAFNHEAVWYEDWPHGEIWVLGDEGCVAALMHESLRRDYYDLIPAPYIDRETMLYDLNTQNRKIRVYRTLDVRLTLEDLFARLQIEYGK